MPKQIIIAEQHRIAAVFSEDQIQELVVATGTHQVGDIYLGIVENVLPGIDAAFVNIGDPDRNGFIHVSDLGPLRLKRTAGAITELLTPQQKVLVQVMKEPTGNKGPRLTGNITLPGRYLVLMPFGRGVNLSRRIKSENERNRLRALAILLKPAGMGLLVRTEAENRPEEAIIEDLESLQKQWEAIQQEAISTRAPALLNRDDDFVQRVLRDMYSEDVNRIVVDSHTGVKRVKQQLMSWSVGKAPQGVLIDHHRDRQPVMEYFRVNAAIKEALKPRVDLPSGGYVIIEPTEALTVVDVNSGSFTRSATARETVLWTNCEAATEIARQLRLRNLAGVIIIDFIDMDSRRDQLQVLEHFNKALKADKARPQIAQLSELGLVELTRKRQGQNIYELFGRPCSTCGGLGHLVHLPSETAAREFAPLGIIAPAPKSDRESTILPPVAGSSYRSESASQTLSPSLPKSSSAFPTVEDIPDGSGMPSLRGDYRSSESRPVLPTPYGQGEAPRDSFEQENYWETDPYADDLATGSDLDVDVMNHPSYQESGAANNSRRRRRRRIGDENERPEEESGKLSPFMPSTAPASQPGIDPKWMSEPEPATSKPFSSTGPKSIRLDPSRIERPAKPETSPPEIVSVEMTPEEQQVYAFMGVSPIVRLNRQLKNPKAATVIVKLPGQAEEDIPYETAQPSTGRSDVARTEVDRTVPNFPTEQDFDYETAQPSTDRSDVDRTEADRTVPSFPTEQNFDSDSKRENEDTDTADFPAEPNDVGMTSSESDRADSLMVRRRRRRRSSATDGENNQ
ncbi:Rne/Rng family ribonuclease [Argonema galeatum]|uniref:Rne/Rng family ribonuclease n=1 Tax=Argonema galeatum TaxID=2942762 RepID=UPI002012E5CA|nr:Rne/Rng family ribonuclease [Argonema galeatum]MCL1468440.1 Rne/Rng family ribonuclease [Argonema galeatum A003/A1]